jgi:hypothetical protein
MSVLEGSGVTFFAERTEKNLGCVRGLNYGLKKYPPRGKYLTPLAGDDWWDMENLKYKVAFCEEHPDYKMVYGNGYNYDNQTEELSLYYTQPSISGWILRELLTAPNINPEGIMYHVHLLKELNYYDENAKVEDRDLWYRVARRTPIGYLHKPLTFYRNNHGGNISSNIEHMREGNEYFFKKYEAEFPKEIQLARLRQYQFFAHHLATYEPSMKSLRYLLRNYKFDWLYNKQIIKCALNMLKGRK